MKNILIKAVLILSSMFIANLALAKPWASNSQVYQWCYSDANMKKQWSKKNCKRNKKQSICDQIKIQRKYFDYKFRHAKKTRITGTKSLSGQCRKFRNNRQRHYKNSANNGFRAGQRARNLRYEYIPKSFKRNSNYKGR